MTKQMWELTVQEKLEFAITIAKLHNRTLPQTRQRDEKQIEDEYRARFNEIANKTPIKGSDLDDDWYYDCAKEYERKLDEEWGEATRDKEY